MVMKGRGGRALKLDGGRPLCRSSASREPVAWWCFPAPLTWAGLVYYIYSRPQLVDIRSFESSQPSSIVQCRWPVERNSSLPSSEDETDETSLANIVGRQGL